jgi:hypothetical protein
MFKWFLSFFSSKDEEVIEDNSLQVLEEAEERAKRLVEDKKRREREIISESQDNIKALSELCELVEGTIYFDKLNKVVELTSEIHDKIITDDRIDIKKLRSFNSWKTVEFIDTFNHLFDPLRPKEISEDLLSDFKLKNEVEEVVEEEVKEQTEYEKYLNKLSNIINSKEANVSDLKIHLSLCIYEFIKENDLSYNAKTNKEVKFSDAEVFQSFIEFLNKNSDVSLDSIYVCSSKDGDKPILLDLRTYELYLYDFTTNVKKNSTIIKDDLIVECCKTILKNK